MKLIASVLDRCALHSGSKPVFLLAPHVGAKQAEVDPFSHIFGARSHFSCTFCGAREAQWGQKKT